MSSISAKIILDSFNAATGDRLTTFAIHVPRFILAEVLTHRALSRNGSSSRAIPAKKVRHQVIQDPVIPVHFGKAGKGMQAHGDLPPLKSWLAKRAWLLARYPAVSFHWFMSDILGLTKQISNRILEPWMWTDVLITATEWKNFFTLRCHEDAQPEFREVAIQMRSLLSSNTPQRLYPSEYHLPFIRAEEADQYPLDVLKQISAARCARVSYLLPDSGIFSTSDRDVDLCKRLMGPPLHASPFEHVSIALPTSERQGNFVGWGQWRKNFDNEASYDYHHPQEVRLVELQKSQEQR